MKIKAESKIPDLPNICPITGCMYYGNSKSDGAWTIVAVIVIFLLFAACMGGFMFLIMQFVNNTANSV